MEWLEPLAKPQRIQSAPTLSSLRRELQLFYLKRSQAYGWEPLASEEVLLTGTLLKRDSAFEDEILSGVDFIPDSLGIHDPLRDTWLVIDLSFQESVPKELLLEQVPAFFGRAGRTAVGRALR